MPATYTKCPACRALAGYLTNGGKRRECAYCHHDWPARTRAMRSPVVSLAYATAESPLARGEKKDCAVRALAVAACVSYDEAHAACAAEGREPRQGTHPYVIARAARRLAPGAYGLPLSDQCLYGRTARAIAAAYPVGHYVLWSNSHAFALCDGTLHDWANKHGLARVVGGVRLA